LNNNTFQTHKGGWEELENAVFTGNKLTLTTDSKKFSIKPDGTKLFTINSTLMQVETRPLSIRWDPDTAGDIEDIFPITDDALPFGLCFKTDDGTKMYILGLISNRLFEYKLLIPWVPSSIVDAPVTMSLSASPSLDCTFSRDGDFAFFATTTGVTRYPLPIFWSIASNITNDSFVSGFSVSSVVFKTEGDLMYLGNNSNKKITQYTLSAIWVISAPTQTGQSPTLSIEPSDLFFRTNGIELFVFDSPDLLRFHLDDSWEISIMSHFSNRTSLMIGTVKFDVTWKPGGKKFIILDTMNITEFTVTYRYNTNNAVQGVSFPIDPIDSNIQCMYWRKNGKQCFVIGISSIKIHQLNVSIAWEVSTMSNPGISKIIVGAFTGASGLYIRDDGFKLYVADQSGDDFYEFDMTISFDIDTLVLLRFLIVPGIGNLAGLFFKLDGRFVYFGDRSQNAVHRFFLRIAWNISTIIFVAKLTVSTGLVSVRGLFIREDKGNQLFIIGTTNDNIITFNMSKEFNFGIIDNLGNKLIDNLGNTLVYQ